MTPNDDKNRGAVETPSSTSEAVAQHATRAAVPDHELLRRIGGGSYGEVWLAKNVMRTYRAVKVVYRRNFEDAHPFDREFKGIQRFEPISRSHDGLVDILQIGRNDAEGYFYYVMELADAAKPEHNQVGRDVPIAARRAEDSPPYQPRTLRADLKHRGRLPADECVQIALALTSALAHLHKHRLVHRDVKPSNIIFVNGAPKLADIGLVTDADTTQSFVGTEGYIPPEGPGAVQADIFILGKVLYEISTGQDRREFPDLPPNLKDWSDRASVLELNEVVLKACATEARN